MTNTPTTLNPPMVWPAMRFADAPGAIRFLVDAFGFEETLVVPDAHGGVAHAELRWPLGGGIMLGSANDQGVHADMAAGHAATYVVTDDPDALFARVAASGIEIVQGLHDEDYGSRGFTVRDPEGNSWTFGTYRGA